ncbi:MAG: O-antigen ligase family protein [Bdellovibrionales bacterium]|nr:O-antigen ligase family protein [Bdellovibrionales bacterium]
MAFWALALLFLVFVSKLSLTWMGIPSQVSVIIFQHGLHPYMNVILSFLLGLPLVFYTLHHHDRLNKLGKVYRTLVIVLLLTLFLETLLQFIFMDNHKGLYGWAALASTYWIIVLFGVFLPAMLDPKKAVRFLSFWSVIFVILSLGLLAVRPDLTFKGGRFIGIFKHIPYMVTCATVGTVFPLACLQQTKRPWVRALWIVGILLSVVALILTGTRSALAAVMMAWVLWLLRVPTKHAGFRFFKFSAALIMTVTLVLFGAQMAEYASDIATGKKGLVDREAQDGVASRMEEVERGWEYFETSPWIGQGLLSKFSGKDDLNVESYNSFKDPHNIFASAGVVGGWPFIVWTGIFLLLLVVMAVKVLMSENSVLHIFGIYAMVQIPILIIYHWHLSLGGMADRFYWLVFGYLALHIHQTKRPQPQPEAFTKQAEATTH